MAKITVNYDNQTKSLQVLIDGVEVPDVMSAHFEKYEYYDRASEKHDVYCSIGTKSENDNGVVTYTTHMASEHKDRELAIASGGIYDKKTGIITTTASNKGLEDISKYFSRD